MSQTSDTHVSSLGDYWSASDHSSVQSWSSENVKPTEERELELLASETLSLSDDDCGSTATPTFSDECEAPQAVAATGNSGRWGCVTHSVVPTASPNCSRHIGLLSEIAKVEDVAKQLDFGSVTVLAQLGSHDATHHQTDAAAACGRSVLEDVESCTSKLKAAASQTLITLCSEDSDSDSSTSQLALQVNAASARPSSRRRAALDSDSESEELSRHCVNGATLPPQMPSTSVYNFDVSDSADTSDADIPDTDTGLRSPLEAPAPVRAGYQPEQGRSVIVLDSSEDDNAASCRPHSYLLCRCVVQGIPVHLYP